MRDRVPFASVIIQTLPAPVVRPPSSFPIVSFSVAEILPVPRSRRETLGSPQLGTQRLPKPAARPEQGALPTGIVATIALAFGSIRVTLFFCSFETQTCSSIAIQSGMPGMLKTCSGFKRSMGIRTDRSFTPGRLGGAGVWVFARVGTVLNTDVKSAGPRVEEKEKVAVREMRTIRSCLIRLTLGQKCERALRASHGTGARRRSGARGLVWGSPRGEAPRLRLVW